MSTTTTDSSVSSFSAALIFNSSLTLVFWAAFSLLRTRNANQKIYAPKTYCSLEPNRRPPNIPPGSFSWLSHTLRLTEGEFFHYVGLDAYMLMRFIRIGLTIFGLGTVPAVILMLVNAVNGGTQPGLGSIAFGNVEQFGRLWVHLLTTITFCCGTIYLLHRETKIFIRLRQKYLTSTAFATRLQARTLLVTNIPTSECNPDFIRRIFAPFPGEIQHVEIGREVTRIEKSVNRRAAIHLKLEAAECKLIRVGNSKKSKRMAKVDDHSAAERGDDSEGRNLNEKEGIDSIRRYRSEMVLLNTEIGKMQADIENFPVNNSAFVVFASQLAAHMAAQSLTDGKPFTYEPRWVGIPPEDVVWDNIGINPWKKLVRVSISFAMCALMMVFWSIITGFVSNIANLNSLTSIFPSLSSLVHTTDPGLRALLGIIQGVLPTLAVAVLNAILPIILYQLSKFEGIPAFSRISVSLMQKLHWFYLWTVLLVFTLVPILQDVLLNTSLLNTVFITKSISENVPKAAGFFINYILLLGFTGPAQDLLQIVSFALKFIKLHFHTTPRAVLAVHMPRGVDFGTTVPTISTVFTIGLFFANIAPLIVPVSAIYFGHHYIAYRYNLSYVYETERESGALWFPKAMRFSYAGLYLTELVMLALFVSRGQIVQPILTILLIFVTAFSDWYLFHAYGPLTEYLPASLPLRQGIPIPSFEEPSPTDLEQSEHLEPISDPQTLNDYIHPALKRSFPVVWLPKDSRGISDRQVEQSKKDAVNAFNEGSVYDETTDKVIITEFDRRI